MDSATSGSLQSSSGGGTGGGDDELDSRPDHLSAFFHGGASAALSLPPLSHPFDSLSHYLSPPSPLLPFSSTPTPAPTPTNPNQSRSFLSSSHGSAAAASPSAAASSGAPAVAPQRSSRKRTRASRRAPTTVLTTDTTNFRAMVQEFTGIPSPPFAAAAAGSTLQYRSARFGHLLSGGGGASSSGVADPSAPPQPQPQPQPPPYLLRPFAQKLQPFHPLSSSSCPIPTNTHPPTATTTGTSTTNTISISTATTTCSSSSNLTTPTNTNYQLPSSHHSLLTTQHPILSFQSLLQSQPPLNYTVPNMLTFSTRPPHFAVSSTQYGSADVGLHPGLIGSQELSGWAGGHEASQSRPVGPSYGPGSTPQQRGSSCKVNYSSAAGSSTPDQFNAEKGSSAAENAAAGAATTTTTTTTTRGEGTVDSWIYSSHDH